MTMITLPPDVEKALAEAARRQGKTAEELAVESLRKLFVLGPPLPPGESLYDFLAGHIGVVSGSPGAWSEKGGERFAEGLEDKYREGTL